MPNQSREIVKNLGKLRRARAAEARADRDMHPTMAALNPRQREFVRAYVRRADGNMSEAARIAGYRDGPNIASIASHLFARDDIRAAILEESRARLLASAPGALAVIEDIAANPDHKKQFDAALAILGRSGLTERREVDVRVTHELTVVEKWQQLIRGKLALGQDPRELLDNLTETERAKVLEGVDYEILAEEPAS